MGTLMPLGAPGGRGFGFITGAAVGAHVVQRGNEDKLVSVATEYPGLLALGPDIGAALVVKGDKAEVIGRSVVIIVDGKDHDGHPYLTLVPGDRYDLKTRIATLLPPEARRAAAIAPGMLRRGPAVSEQLEGDWEAVSQTPDRITHYVLHLKNQADGTVLARLDTVESNARMTLGEVRQQGTRVELFQWGATVDSVTGDSAPVFKGALNREASEITGDLMPMRGLSPRYRATTKLTFKKAVAPSAASGGG
jgi:hypothetical protein